MVPSSEAPPPTRAPKSAETGLRRAGSMDMSPPKVQLCKTPHCDSIWPLSGEYRIGATVTRQPLGYRARLYDSGPGTRSSLPCAEAFGHPVPRQRTVFVADVETDMIAFGIDHQFGGPGRGLGQPFTLRGRDQLVGTAHHHQQRAGDPFCRTHECELVPDPLRFLRGAGVSARAEHLLLDRRRL